MSSFEKALPIILKHEGGLANNPADPGGITNFGISFRYLSLLIKEDPSLGPEFEVDGQPDIDATDIRKLSEEKASEIYRIQWWNKYHYGDINDQSLATKIFDLAVNIGGITANKLLQEAVNQVADKILLRVDGMLSLENISIINKQNSIQLLIELRNKAKTYYKNIVAKNSHLTPFLKGWLTRLEDA